MDITLNIIVTVSSTGQLIKHKITVIATKLLLTFELISRQNNCTVLREKKITVHPSAETQRGQKQKITRRLKTR